jgi:hypothetical protein
MIRRAAVRALERLLATRIVALQKAIDEAAWPEGSLVLRIAADEVLVTAVVDSTAVADPHAIVERETGLSSVWLESAEALDFLERECDWELPTERPAFAQGMVAGVPLKMWFERDRVLFLVPAPFAVDLSERLR